MRKIDSVKNPFIIELNKLKQSKYRQVNRKFLIEGYHLVNEAYRSNLLETVLITKKEDYFDNVENIMVTDNIISKLAYTNAPQGIVGIAKEPTYMNVQGNKFLLLDNVQDPGNVGTLIRTAVGFGIDMIILGDGSADVYNDKTIRATQGALFNVAIIRQDLLISVKKLKEMGVSIVGTALQNGISLSNIPKLSKYALILGNEGSGVRSDILDQTDYNVYINISEKIDSLNVGIAGGIILYHLSSN